MPISQQELLSLLSGDYSSLTVGFNERHGCNYMTAKRYAEVYREDYTGGVRDPIHWPSDEERVKAVNGNSVWTVQWFPHTPVGSITVGASTLDAAVKYALTFD